jgi:hypothetical protein
VRLSFWDKLSSDDVGAENKIQSIDSSSMEKKEEEISTPKPERIFACNTKKPHAS